MDYWPILGVILVFLPFQQGRKLRHGSHRMQCALPALPSGVLFQTNNEGSTLLYRCRKGFSTLGDVHSFCDQGQWSTPPPMCIARGCHLAYHLTNGRMVLGYGGAMATFMCKKGYMMEGDSNLVCDGKKWNGTIPKCTDRRGERRARIAYSHRDHVKSHTDWLKGSDYSCIKRTSHVKPPIIRHTQATTQWAVVEGKPRLFTAYRCQWGYISKGKVKNMYCQNGNWIGAQPKCTPLASARVAFMPRDQSDPAKMSHSDWLVTSDYSCMGSAKSPHRTKPKSPDQGHYRLRHGVIDGTPRLYAGLVCNQGYTVRGEVSNRYCRGGVWVGPDPECTVDKTGEDTCDEDNGGCEHICQESPDGYSCSCYQGYQLSDDGHNCSPTEDQKKMKSPLSVRL